MPTRLTLVILLCLAAGFGCKQKQVIEKHDLGAHTMRSLFEVECKSTGAWKDQSEGERVKYDNGRCALLLEPRLNPQILGLIHPWMKRIRIGIPQNKEYLYVDIANEHCLTVNLFFASAGRSMALYYREERGMTANQCLQPEYRSQVYYKRDRVLAWAVDVLNKYSLDNKLQPGQAPAPAPE